MEKKLTFELRLKEFKQERWISDKIYASLFSFYQSYKQALQGHTHDPRTIDLLFIRFLEKIKWQLESPYVFEPYHEMLREPFDYYQFGVDFIQPLIDETHSSIEGEENLKMILEQLDKKENAIFLANHQIEADPQAISALLDEKYPDFAHQLIFVAGERVITDPIAVPFSLGRNLLCIYSKRYIDHPPELKEEKQLHNKRTMEKMSALLKEGGKAIYVAPAGGRDRANKEGVVEVAPFDPQSIEMFHLMAKKSGQKTHFYPMALSTYDLLPPPDTIQIEIGEERRTKRGAIHLAICQEIDMEKFPGSDLSNKHERRQKRADFIWNKVAQAYRAFPE